MSLARGSATRYTASGNLLCRKLYQNGILSDTFNALPRNDQIVLPAKAQKAAASVNDQRQNLRVLAIKFKIPRTAKAGAVTQIDDFKSS